MNPEENLSLNSAQSDLSFNEESWMAIDEFKKRYYDVYFIQIYDQDFIYRIPSIEDFKKLETRFPDIYDLQEAVCREYVLDPVIEDWSENIPAGYVESLAKAIINDAGVWWDGETIKQKLENASTEISSLQILLPLTIKKAFPEYSFEELRSWSLSRQFEYYQYAKWLINVDNPTFTLELVGDK
ncbi:hypothetical protein [Enterococcus sp. DIV1059_2]|uniref:hypothetical protein n=1 Tax=Enterococcus sp. DIV1059_2 TaxID=2774664 RepID=UPI003F23914D